MRWLLLKDLQLLRRSPLVTALLVIYPIVLAVLIGLAISRSPEKPRVAFLNQIPKSTGLSLGDTGGFSQEEARSRLCAKIECVTASSRADVEQKVKDGEVLGGLILPPDFLSKLQGELTTNSSQPATVEVLVNQDDPLKAQIVDDRISSLLNQANLLLSAKITDVAVNYEQLLANGGEFEIPFLDQTVHILGLERSEQILRSVQSTLPPAQRGQVAQVTDFARLARQNLALANQLLSSIRQPIAVDKQVVGGNIPPLDTFAVAVAAAVTLLFVTVLLVSGSLALEREENTFTRLTRGLVSREGLLLEKAVARDGGRPGGDAADAARDHALPVDRLEPDLPDRPRDPAGGGRLVRARPRDRSSSQGGSGQRAPRLRPRASGGVHLAGAFGDGQQGAPRRDPRDRGRLPLPPGPGRPLRRALRLGSGPRPPVPAPGAAHRRLSRAGAEPRRFARKRWVALGATGTRPRIRQVSFPATRLRRLRRTEPLRDLVRETELTPEHLVQPLFITAGEGVREPIASMPGMERLSISEAVAEVTEIAAAGIRAVLLFGIPASKDEVGSEAYDDEGVVQMAVRALKEAHPEVVVITDVCLCEYTSHGHCGIVREGEVDNDLTIELLAKTAISHAAAGADAVAPSDMMDGRVGRDPRPARRRGPLLGPDHRLQRQVRLRLLRPLPGGRRLDAGVRRPPRLPDGSGQRRRGDP